MESGADGDCDVVEIGPGVGCLTVELAERAASVLSYEVDVSLMPVLAETLSEYRNVQVVFEDFLRRNFAEDLREHGSQARKILCANLPYNITSPILTRALESELFDSITVMIQKEVAERICAKPGTADYGALTLLCQWYSEPELLFTVSPDCFVPQPKVTSAVVRMTRRPQPPADVDSKELFRVVRSAFNMRRKTLSNALSPLCGKEAAQNAIRNCGFSESVRGETLSLTEFAALTNELNRLK